MKEKERAVKVLLTGGHVTPALAVIAEIKSQKPSWEIVFVGRLYALEGDRTLSEEYRLLEELRVRFLPLTSARWSRSLRWRDLLSLFKFPLGLITAFGYCFREKPSVIMSFGGYVALPVVVAARAMGVPVVTHEQTRRLGLANRIISILAQRICVSFPETLRSWPDKKVVFTGLPIRREIFSPPQKTNFSIDQDVPLIYITGGATGAVSLNELIYQVLPSLTHRFMIVHQTGRKSFSRAQEVWTSLAVEERRHYLPVPYLGVLDHSYFLHLAKLIISRSGANTVGEIAALGKVGLFIPLPWSAGGEQELNAKYLVDYGSAEILEQPKITPELLEKTITFMIARIEVYQKKAQILAPEFVHSGAQQVVAELAKILRD